MTRASIRIASVGLLIAVLVLCLEAGSYIVLGAVQSRNPILFRVTARELADRILPGLPRFLRCETWICPHPSLGWWHQPGTRGDVGFGPITADEVGSRVVPGQSGPILVSSYGDSFTQGIEVDDESTWQAHLARRSGIRVQNFGVMGYGPDQALRYLQHNLERGHRVPVVILGAMPESLNRLMSAFRPFYTYPALDIPLGFKPILVPSEGTYAFRNFAPERPLDRAELETAIERAGPFDAFHEARTQVVRFPFSASAGRYLWRYGLRHRFTWPADTVEAHRRMAFVLEAMSRAARVHGFIPVLLIMPMTEKELRRPRPAAVHAALTYLGPDAARDIIVVDIAAERRHALASPEVAGADGKYVVRTHPSTDGNRLIGALLHRRLCAEPRITSNAELAERLCRASLGADSKAVAPFVKCTDMTERGRPA